MQYFWLLSICHLSMHFITLCKGWTSFNIYLKVLSLFHRSMPMLCHLEHFSTFCYPKIGISKIPLLSTLFMQNFNFLGLTYLPMAILYHFVSLVTLRSYKYEFLQKSFLILPKSVPHRIFKVYCTILYLYVFFVAYSTNFQNLSLFLTMLFLFYNYRTL